MCGNIWRRSHNMATQGHYWPSTKDILFVDLEPLQLAILQAKKEHVYPLFAAFFMTGAHCRHSEKTGRPNDITH